MDNLSTFMLAKAPVRRKITGHIVAVESKRQLSTDREIQAAVAQVAGECLAM